MSFDTRADHARLTALQERIEHWLAGHEALLARLAPAISGWSAEKHLAHVALANELVLRNLKSLVKGSGLLVVEGGQPVPGALELLVSGRLPRGQAQSPRIVRPPAVVERALLREWLADARRELAALDPLAIRSTSQRIPHQILGPLDAPQWLRFGVVHTRHHLAIAREVLLAHDERLAPALSLPD